MPTRSTVGQLMVQQALPPELRHLVRGRTLDGKGVRDLLQEVATRKPGLYRQVSKRLMDVGREVATATGGFSFGLQHMLESPAAARVRAEIEQEIERIRADKSLSADDRDRRVVDLLSSRQKTLEKAIYDEALAEKNPLGLQVLSGSRGKPMNLKSLRGGDLLYTDHRGDAIPVPVTSPYSKGLTPVEYWAGAFGARQGVFSTKAMTAKAGFYSKRLQQAAHDLVVVGEDEEDQGLGRDYLGLPIDVDDADNEGALLARPVGGYDRNTVLTPKILKDLKSRGFDRILVRSPLVGGPPEGGVYARDVGVRERGGLPPRGDFVGLTAAQSIGEKFSQGMLSNKHSGGVAGASNVTGGYDAMNDLIEAPKSFRGAATHAQVDGTVTAVRDAPQGGHYVEVSGEEHYVPAGRQVAVKERDAIEAGDVLSDGVPQPSEIVKHKGLGEGRRYFVRAFMDGMKASGLPANRRNVELVAAGLLRYVRMSDEHGDYSPDDLVPYAALARDWQPRDGSETVSASSAVGKYLEQPVLHHTIGTRVKSSMLPELERFGVRNLVVHRDPPPFESEFVRASAVLQNHPQWMTRHLGSNLQKGTLDAAQRGLESDTHGTSFVPSLAERVNFGRQGLTRSWNPEDIRPVPRDGDGDGRIEDGTPRERDKPR